MTPNISSHPDLACPNRRRLVGMGLAWLAAVPALVACSPKATAFKSTDVTGASFANDFNLKDHLGIRRTLKVFKDKIVVVFFGFTQCPDVWPRRFVTIPYLQ